MPTHAVEQLEHADLAGLDALEREQPGVRSKAARTWSAAWPKLAAVGIAIVLWQLVVWSNWKPDYVLPGPRKVFPELGKIVKTVQFWESVGVTMRRALVGFAIALVVGSAVGAAIARVRLLRTAVGSLITGLQTMPSVTWFPLALVLFKLSEGAILFVVVLGAAPAIANGIVSGIDHVPPMLLRAGRVLGARGFTMLRSVILPAALPGYVSGLKQGWAFAWRSLMAGELLVIIRAQGSLGVRIDNAADLNDYPVMIAYMIVILIIGIMVDSIFGVVERRIRARRGLLVA